MLYGGIDSQEVTERATDPSGAMGAIQRILSNDVACKHVARDFARPPAERRLFPGIEPDVAARRLARGRRGDPQGDRPPARADPRPLRRRRTPPRSSARSSCSPASSPTRRRRRASRSARATPAGRTRRPDARRRPALHDPRLARRGHVPAAAARVPLRVTAVRSHDATCDATSSSCAAWPASASPSRSARRAAAREGEGRALRRPVLRRLQRLRRLGHDVPDGPQGRQRDQPPLQGRRHPDARARTSSPRPRSTSRAG